MPILKKYLETKKNFKDIVKRIIKTNFSEEEKRKLLKELNIK
jgi:hypothetical protein